MASNDDPLRLYRIGERKRLEPRRFVIGGLLAAGEAMLLIGAPKGGKSAVGVASAVAVANGQAFFGKRVRRGLVVYVAAERFEETCLRLEVAFRGADDPPVRIVRARMYGDAHDANRLASAIFDLAGELQLDPVLIVFDTVAAMLRDGAGDENSQRDIGKLTEAIDRVRIATGAAVMVVHHSKRNEPRSRGSESLEAWAETVALVEAKGETRRLRVLRSNTVEEGVKATFTLQPVELGVDAETGERSSVVLAVPSSAVPTAARSITLTPDAERAFEELRKLTEPVSLGEWRTAVMVAYSPRPGGARRQAFSKAKRTLESYGLIQIGDDETVSVSKPSA